MKIVNKEQQQQIADLVADIEKRTDGELVVVLASQSDSYSYIPLLWAAVLALLTPLVVVMLPISPTTFTTALVQIGVFIFLVLLFQIPAINIRLIPKSVRYWRASNMARRQFLENNLHHTNDETGVLLFVSEAEHYVEIIADRGINRLVDHQPIGQFIFLSRRLYRRGRKDSSGKSAGDEREK